MDKIFEYHNDRNQFLLKNKIFKHMSKNLGNTVSINTGGRGGNLSIKKLYNPWKNESDTGMEKSLQETTGSEH